jgi:hypothetical protein
VQLLFNPATAPPIGGAPETVTITYPDTSTVAGSGFLTDYDNESPYDNLMTATATIKFSGTLTYDPV